MNTLSISNDQRVMNNLAKANLVIDKFINSCSHSLRGPVKTIRGLVNLMNVDGESQAIQVDSMLRMIETSAKQLDHTLNELEQFLVNSKKEVTTEKVNMKSLINALVRKYKKELAFHEISVSAKVEQQMDLYTDKERLTMILALIFSNAIVFSDDHKRIKTIHISANMTDSHYEVALTDNGIGITPENKERIFQLFYRGSEKSKGTGIGLYIVQEAVEKMGGQIQVESKLFEGSKFTISVPIKQKKIIF